jgi:hypothetical protein
MVLMAAFPLGLAVPNLITAVASTPALPGMSARNGGVCLVQAGTGWLLAMFGVFKWSGKFARLVETTKRVLLIKFPLGM